MLFPVMQIQALEALPEASSPQNPGYVVFYTGHCAERVGIKVAGGRETSVQGLSGLVHQAERSVEPVLAKCPNAQEIVVDVRSNQTPTLASYFSLSRADNWKPSSPLSKGELKSLLESEGYQAFAGPRPIYSVAYWRFVDNRFDVFYGNDLENRMVATHVEKSSDEYRLRGQIFDLGYNESGRVCTASREGYALWGSFTLTVSSKLASLPMSINWCGETQQPGDSETTEFFALGYNLSLDATLADLRTKLASSSRLIVSENTEGPREALIDREFYRVYATQDDLCSAPEFDVIYRVNHERRNSIFSGQYEKAISNVLGALTSRRCGEAKQFTVNAYSAGDVQRWDSITFAYSSRAAASEEVPFRVARRTSSDAAKAHEAYLAANLFGLCEGPFCALPGGRYLNAIYRGDLAIVRQIDGLHREGVYDYLQRSKAALGLGNVSAAIDPSYDVNKVQLLRQVANKYMHAYGTWGEACLDPGFQKQHYEYTTPVVIETDEYGTTTSGGITFEADYTLNPEFFPLRDKLATYRGAKNSNDPSNLEVKGAIYRGIVELTRTGNCRDKTVKEFERQLRALTEAVLTNPGATPPTDAVRPPKPPRIVADPFRPMENKKGQAIAWNAPASMPKIAKGAGRDAPRPMNQQQRMQKMNEEMQAGQQKLEKDMAAIQSRVAEAQKQGKSQAELMQMMMSGQQEMMQLQQKFQEEMQRIQMRYQ